MSCVKNTNLDVGRKKLKNRNSVKRNASVLILYVIVFFKSFTESKIIL